MNASGAEKLMRVSIRFAFICLIGACGQVEPRVTSKLECKAFITVGTPFLTYVTTVYDDGSRANEATAYGTVATSNEASGTVVVKRQGDPNGTTWTFTLVGGIPRVTTELGYSREFQSGECK
jgi:hypothetical protein